MFKQHPHITFLFLLLALSFKVSAQLEMPDSVCIGETKHYNVNPDPTMGSTFSWHINSIAQLNSSSNEIDILWNSSGSYLLEVQELTNEGCSGAIISGLVIVSSGPTLFCQANINHYGNTLVSVPNPEVSNNCEIISILNNYNGSSNASGNYPLGSTAVTFTATDLYGNSSECTSLINVLCDLIAVNDEYYLAINSINNLDIIANDTLCGQNFQSTNITILEQPVNFNITVNPVTGLLLFIPPPGYTGTDSLQYLVCSAYSIINPQGITETQMVCDSAWVIFHIVALPGAHIAGSTTICNGGIANLVITLTGLPPYTIQVFDGSQTTTYAGISSNYYNIVVNPATTTTYTITQVQDASMLTAVGTGEALITVIGPQAYIVTGGGLICQGDQGTTIGLSGSETGMIYTLYLNGVSISGPVSGSGNPLNFGVFNLPGIYTAVSSSLVYSCSYAMYSYAVITLKPSPQPYTVTGGGSCCYGCTEIHVGISQSDVGVWYQLYLNDTILVTAGPGTGGAIDFGYVTESGIYTIKAIGNNGCITQMTGEAVAEIYPRSEAILVSSNQSICAGSYTQLIINISSGTAPYCIGIYNGISITSYCDINCSPYIININPSITSTYAISFIQDTHNCYGLFSGSTTITVDSCASYVISGQVSYDNALSTALDSVILSLKKDNIIVGTTSSSNSGMYQFTSLSPGTYELSASTSLPWGGVNSADALLTLMHFAGIQSLTDLRLQVADVDNHTGVNSTDALLEASRFVEIIPSFPKGDWLFEQHTLSIGNSNITQNIKGLCYGDVNGSYQPQLVKQAASMNLAITGTIEATSFSTLDVPVNTLKPLSFSALSMIIHYPEEFLTVKSVTIGDYNIETKVINNKDGMLRISWYDLREIALNANDHLIWIHFVTKDLKNIEDQGITLSLDGLSEVNDRYGEVIPEINLSSPGINLQEKELTVRLIPNPISQQAEFLYFLPEDSRVTIIIYNMLGGELQRVTDQLAQQQGKHQINFNASGFNQGIYTYAFIVEGTQIHRITSRFIVSK